MDSESSFDWGSEVLAVLWIVCKVNKGVNLGETFGFLCVVEFEGRWGTVKCLAPCVSLRVNTIILCSVEYKPSAISLCEDTCTNHYRTFR